jgi:tetratricopeptide (TPR) repeat protein
MSGISVDLAGRDLKAEAARLLAYSGAVQQQMDQFGHGHPQGGKIAVSYAQACTALGKECLTQQLLRTANKLLGHAMHFLRQNHSMIVFGEHQRVLAETQNNLGCLENKRGNLEPALKHILAAVEIESELEWEVGHAATLLNTCSTLSLLDRHSEALEAAKQAVDMLVAGEKHWDKLAADPESEAGELLPIAFNNLALELEFADDRAQAQQAYEHAITLAMRRWGETDGRTTAIKNAAWQADQAVALGQFRVRKKLKAPPKSAWRERHTLNRGNKAPRPQDARHHALLAATGTRGVAPVRKSELPIIYAEVNNPIHRQADVAPGFHSPRFWAVNEGMAPRRQSSFNKDLRQIGLEMARKGGAKQFPSSVQQTKWGERRVEWVNVPEADLSIIDGSVMSRTRVFSDVCTNTAMEAKDRIMRERQQRTRKFPRDVRVFTKAQTLRDSLRDSLHSLPELA